MANAPLTYLLKIDRVTGDSTVKGFVGDFTVSEFTFDKLTGLADISGAGAGKAQFGSSPGPFAHSHDGFMV